VLSLWITKQRRTKLRRTSGRCGALPTTNLTNSARELRVKGKPVELEAKPLDLLPSVASHAGEVVTKGRAAGFRLAERDGSGWIVGDGGFQVAQAMGDENHPAIVTVPRVGYRLAVPVYCKPSRPRTGPNWIQSRRRGSRAETSGGFLGRWTFQDPGKFGELRISQNSRAARIQVRGGRSPAEGLKREITVARFLRESLGDRPDLRPKLEWNFETPPFFSKANTPGRIWRNGPRNRRSFEDFSRNSPSIAG